MNSIYLLSSISYKDESIYNLPIFEINYIKNDIDFASYDALIFTSKNAACSLNKKYEKWKDVDSYAISNKTAEILESFNANLVYNSNSSNGNEFANDLILKLINKKALYIRSKIIVSKLPDILKAHDIQCDELLAYETICKTYTKENKPKNNSIIVFTSPSSVKCFLKNFNWHESYFAIAIGKTTASYFPDGFKFQISPISSIENCIKIAKSLSPN